MLVNAPVAYASTLEELCAGGFALRGVLVDWTVNWTTRIDALPRECVSHPSAFELI